jgi:hypothetical protein
METANSLFLVLLNALNFTLKFIANYYLVSFLFKFYFEAARKNEKINKEIIVNLEDD